MLALGSGLGFAEVSPWTDKGVSATTFTITAAIWFIVTQWISACLGGYIAGRLRARWFGTHPHEVFFRDTAHGLVTWSVATVFVAGTLASTLFSAIGGGVHAASNVVGAASSAAVPALAPDAAYNADRLFREGPGNTTTQAGADPRAEAGHIIANAATTGSVPDADRTYLAELVASRTGVSPADAQKRVDDYIAAAQDAAAARQRLLRMTRAKRRLRLRSTWHCLCWLERSSPASPQYSAAASATSICNSEQIAAIARARSPLSQSAMSRHG